MTSAAKLYTPQILALATELALYPWDASLTLQYTARSKSCGSTLTLGLDTDTDDRIIKLGIRAQACAIGQASAAILAAHALGRTKGEIIIAAKNVATWVCGDGALPDWPRLDILDTARSYPARHGAIMLPWEAASNSLR